MTLKTLVNDAQNILSLPVSSTVVSSTDPNVRMLKSLATQEGVALARSFTWQAITKEATFTSVAQAEQTNAIPSDFDRLIYESMYNRSQLRRITGPLDSSEWQAQQALSTSLLTDAFRIRGDAILISPTPDAGDTYAFEYVSKNWCQDSGSTGQEAWAADDDTGILDEYLMSLGLIWRYRKARGFDYAEEMATYEIEKAQAQMRDGGGRRTRNFARDTSLYDHANMPVVAEGNWNL